VVDLVIDRMIYILWVFADIPQDRPMIYLNFLALKSAPICRIASVSSSMTPGGTYRWIICGCW